MASTIEIIGDNAQNPEEIIDTLLMNVTNVEGPECQIWEKKEKKLHNKIAEYEENLIYDKIIIGELQKELQEKTEECDQLKMKMGNIEKELAKTSLKGQKENNSSDMMMNARSVIFEKTKVCKNQELQIDALTQQVKSLKEIASISKDMLDIRNMEVKHLQDQLSTLEFKFTAEKDRHALMHTKLERMIKLNEELKAEYQNQLTLFVQLKKAYSLRQNIQSEEEPEKTVKQ